MIYTFYSFKGGVGRSMALANVGELLYRRGLKVLMVDFDLEAPGLERYFDVPEAALKLEEMLDRRGVIDLVISYKDLRSLPALPKSGKSADSRSSDEFPFPVEPLDNFIMPIYERSTNGGGLFLMPAGRRAGNEFTRYADRVRSLSWDDFYANWDGERFFDWFRKQVVNFADVVLVDSRTGVTEMSGVCAYQLADVVVMYVTPNFQSLDGTLRLATSLANPKLIEEGRKGRELSLVFVPSRVEPGEGNKLDEFAERFHRQFGDLIAPRLRFETNAFIDLKVPYVPYYAYVEDVAVREPDRPKAADLVKAFERITATLSQLEPEDSPLARLYYSYYSKLVAEANTPEQQGKLAESVFARLSEEEQEIVHRLFTRLVRLGRREDRSEDTRARVSMKFVDPSAHDLVQKLCDAQLLVIEQDKNTGEQMLQVAQESLIRGWERLKKWINEDSDFLFWRQRLQVAIAEWERSGRDEHALLGGALLVEAEHRRDVRKSDLNSPEQTYISESVVARARVDLAQRKGKRIRASAVSLVILVALLVGVAAWLQARQRDKEAQDARARNLKAADYVREGNTLAEGGNPDGAIEAYTRAIEVKPDYADAYFDRGNSYRKKGDDESAIADYDQAVKLKPDFWEAYTNRANAYGNRGDRAKAIADYDQALKYKSDSAQIYYNQAVLYYKEGALEQAISDLSQAVNLDPKYDQAYYWRGRAYSSKGDYDQAIADYNKAIELRSDDAEAYFNRGVAYKSKGDRDNAIANLQIAIKFTNDDTLSQNAKSILQQLGKKVAITPVVAAPPKIYLQYNDPGDANVLDIISALLSKKGYKVQPKELNPGKTAGDVRYYYEEDKQNATAVRSVVSDGLSTFGIKMSIGLISLAGRYPSVPRGHIEVWLPSLKTRQQQQSYQAPPPFEKSLPGKKKK